MDWSVSWLFDHVNQTYHPGETASITCTFRNTGKKPILLRRLGAHFDWMSEEEWVCSNANVVVQPNSPLLFGQTYTIPVSIPLDAPIGYFKFRVGADVRVTSGEGWSEDAEVQWHKATHTQNDTLAIQYPAPRSFQVFISHSEKDRNLANFVADYIKRCGQSSYLAEAASNPELGRRLWEDKITGALGRSNVMLVLWTGNSASSPAVQREIQMATQMRKLVLPAVSEGTPIPPQFQNLVYVKFRAETQLDAIKTVLQTLLNYEREQTQNQQAGAVILGLLALLVIGGIASSGR